MKSKDKEKSFIKGTVALVMIILIVVSLCISGSYKSIKAGKNECLIDIAKNYCEEQGLVYSRISWDLGLRFFCKQDPRISSINVRFFFLEHEKKECLK